MSRARKPRKNPPVYIVRTDHRPAERESQVAHTLTAPAYGGPRPSSEAARGPTLSRGPARGDPAGSVFSSEELTARLERMSRLAEAMQPLEAA